MIKIIKLLFTLIFCASGLNAQEPVKNFIDNYYGSINNLGDISIDRQSRDELQSKILDAYFRLEASLLANDLRPEGAEFIKAPEYFNVLRLDFIKGFSISHYLIGNIWFNDDGDLVTIVNQKITDLASGSHIEGNYLLVIALTSYNLSTFNGYIKSITTYKSKIDKKSELEKQKEAEELEVNIWNYTQQINTKKGYEEYTLNYPKSRFLDLAQKNISELNIVLEAEERHQDSIYNAKQEKFTLEQLQKSKQDSLELANLQTQLSLEKLKKSAVVDESAKFLNNLNERMIYLEGGRMTLGCDSDKCRDDEKPATSKFVKPFYIGKYEVTVEEWKSVVGSLPAEFSNVECAKCPISDISYHDIINFMQKLNSLSEDEFRLPYEYEWEYAALGGESYIYSGSDQVEESAEYRDNNGIKSISVVNTKANAFGLYGMSGNVAEWCEDWYSETSYAVSEPLSTGDHKVIRGGSFVDRSNNVRIKSRAKNVPEISRPTIGFRLVKDVRE